MEATTILTQGAMRLSAARAKSIFLFFNFYLRTYFFPLIVLKKDV
jgi:hypothetical protein